MLLTEAIITLLWINHFMADNLRTLKLKKKKKSLRDLLLWAVANNATKLTAS
jgi:hypothetical protein